MPELRLILLIVGGLFVLGLALWEIRRQRQVPRQSRLETSGPAGERMSPAVEGGSAESTSAGAGAGFADGGGFASAGRVHREPIITLPELQPVDPRGEPRLSGRREPAHDPPVVEVDDASFSRLTVQGETGATDPERAHSE